jgi:hypothetical protein
MNLLTGIKLLIKKIKYLQKNNNTLIKNIVISINKILNIYFSNFLLIFNILFNNYNLFKIKYTTR